MFLPLNQSATQKNSVQTDEWEWLVQVCNPITTSNWSCMCVFLLQTSQRLTNKCNQTFHKLSLTTDQGIHILYQSSDTNQSMKTAASVPSSQSILLFNCTSITHSLPTHPSVPMHEMRFNYKGITRPSPRHYHHHHLRHYPVPFAIT